MIKSSYRRFEVGQPLDEQPFHDKNSDSTVCAIRVNVYSTISMIYLMSMGFVGHKGLWKPRTAQ